MTHPYTHQPVASVRTNIDIDDELLAAAMKAGGFKTKKETVEAGLRLLARKRVYQEIRKLAGKVKWEGDLKASRSHRLPDGS